jgi:hypothetical protein
MVLVSKLNYELLIMDIASASEQILRVYLLLNTIRVCVAEEIMVCYYNIVTNTST